MMSLLYIYVLCVAACVVSVNAIIHVAVSARVGSTVVLPCELTKVFTQTSVVRWSIDNEVVFERSSDHTAVGEGYEGRVDVPEDELRKGNCSLLIKNVRLTDDAFYKSFMMEHVDRNNKMTTRQEIITVTLSVEALPKSAAVESTVVLPCEWRDLSIQTPHVQWTNGRKVVFERQGKDSFPGEGYEGRVDVPEDELLKGNCSLVLKNVRVTDAAEYRSSMLLENPKKSVLVQKLQLSVYNGTEEKKPVPHNHVKNFHYLWILIILPGLVLLVLGV